MGCSTSAPLDLGLNIKSIPLRLFLTHCKDLDFDDAKVYNYLNQVCKTTVYEYRYVRGLREWVGIHRK